ncbi:MAG: radical SAM protein, partial [bacterium]
MQNKSVLFIEPMGNRANVFDNYMKLPLLGSLILGTILHDKGYPVKILNENLLDKRIDPFEINADIFCITALTLSANRAKMLAKQIRQIYPHSKILVGGIHASLLPEEFTDFADHVVTGEAEANIVDIVEGAYTEKIIKGKPIPDMNDLPLVNYGLMENGEKMGYIPIMTSRGCPFDCNFCTVTRIFGRKYRAQKTARVIAEIENALKYFKARDIFFYDDNLTANRRRADELFECMTRKSLPVSWSAQVRSDIGKHPELIGKMRSAGCNRMFIGFESINEEILKAFKKSQTRSDIERAIAAIHAHGINIHGMFILGEDNDTLDNIAGTVEFAVQKEIDTVQFMVLTPFPGTVVYEQLKKENRIYHDNWDHYDGMFIVFRPGSMNPLKLQLACVSAYRRFYSLRRTFMDTVAFLYNICLDALVLNFSRLFRYDLHTILVKIGARFIVSRWLKVNKGYLKYLEQAENAV